jgi:hypothetical protein
LSIGANVRGNSLFTFSLGLIRRAVGIEEPAQSAWLVCPPVQASAPATPGSIWLWLVSGGHDVFHFCCSTLLPIPIIPHFANYTIYLRTIGISNCPKSTADMSDADAILDEHLAKFPPFKGPIIGGNFNVDENVLSGQEAQHSFNVPVDG